MFQRSTTDKRRVLIVDFNHMAWQYAFGNAKGLSVTLKQPDGTLETIDTTIPAYTIKALNRWACNGSNPLAVCFDGEGSALSRKAYFAQNYGVKSDGTPQGYKARREPRDPLFYKSINLTFEKLLKGGVSCYRAQGFEADDLIKACVDNAKINYPDLPIDIITGDADLLPLVDEQVSVFMRNNKTTYAEDKSIEKLHYVQVTPANFQSYVEGMSSYKNLVVPYNSVLLAKLLRGDKSDEIPGKPDWKPKMYNKFVNYLLDTGEDLSSLFRYDAPTIKYYYRGTETEIPASELESVPKDQRTIVCGDPPALTRILELFERICEPEDVEHVRRVYNGINLNGAFQGLPANCNRTPARIITPIKGYHPASLAGALGDLRINLGV